MKHGNEKDSARFSDLLSVISRRRWYLIIPVLVIVLGGMVLALTLPKIYQAQALILIRSPKITKNLVASPEPADIYMYVNTISRQLMSRPNLEKTINRFGLLADPELGKLSMEEKIALLQDRITVETIEKDNRLLDAFFITVKDQNPQVAMQVANAFAGDVITENIEARRQHTAGATTFLADEQAAVKQKLEHFETALKEYRQKYMGGLPEQLDANLRVLDRLQNQLMVRQENLKEARFRLTSIENLIADQKKLATTQKKPVLTKPAGEDGGQSLDRLKAKLAELQTRYMDKHPDIVGLKMTIARLQAGQGSAAGKKGPTSGARPAADGKTNPELASYLSQRTEIKNQIQILTEEIGGIQRRIQQHQKLVEETPRRRQELQALKRNYDEVRETYRALLEKKLDADMAITMQRKQQRQQFVLIDPATVPQMPAEPDLKKLFALTLATALAAGAGLVFLKEYTDTSFRKSQDVEPFLGVPLLVEVPVLSQATNRRRKNTRRALTYVCILLTFIFLSSFAVITFKGVDPVKTSIKRYIAPQ